MPRRPRTVTRAVDPSALPDLTDAPRRACLAWTASDGPHAVPATWTRTGDRYDVRLPPGEGAPAAGEEVVLLADDGVEWFDLRAVYVRGTVTTAPGLAVEAARTVAWHYGSLREVSDAPR